MDFSARIQPGATTRPTRTSTRPTVTARAPDPLREVRASRRAARRTSRAKVALLLLAIAATIAVAWFVTTGSGSNELPRTRTTPTALDAVATPAASTDTTEPEIDRPVIGIGSAGPDVEALQDLLSAVGSDPGVRDGQFGLATASAVQAFQRSVGLADDGVVGPQTWAALADAESRPLP